MLDVFGVEEAQTKAAKNDSEDVKSTPRQPHVLSFTGRTPAPSKEIVDTRSGDSLCNERPST
jgi:hypothetical protein